MGQSMGPLKWSQHPPTPFRPDCGGAVRPEAPCAAVHCVAAPFVRAAYNEAAPQLPQFKRKPTFVPNNI